MLLSRTCSDCADVKRRFNESTEALQFETDDTPGTGLEDEELAEDPLMQMDLTVSAICAC